MTWRGYSDAGIVFLITLGAIFVLAITWALFHDLLYNSLVPQFSETINAAPETWGVLSYIFGAAAVLGALGLGLAAVSAVHQGGG